jgi:hypothetical protein
MITIPTLQQLYQANITALEAELNITIPLFGKNYLRALAAVQAGKLWLYYKALGLIQKNIFADTADPESMGGTLERFGRVKLGRNPFPATSGEYTSQVSGTLGAVIPVSTTFKSNDDSSNPGFLFILDTEFTLDGINIITVRALTPGLESRLIVGDKLTVTAPVALVNSEIEILTESVIPQEEESISEYRQKILEAFRLEAQGGAGADYRLWASEAQGVAETYPYAASGFTNKVNLYVEATVVDSLDGKGTPTPTILASVESAIEDPTTERPSRKPLTVVVDYLSVSPKDIDITVNSFVGITPEIETLIESAIESELASIRPFVASIDVLSNKKDTFDVNKIISLILQANPGSSFGSIVLEVDGNPVTTYTFTDGNIPFLNSINYV